VAAFSKCIGCDHAGDRKQVTVAVAADHGDAGLDRSLLSETYIDNMADNTRVRLKLLAMHPVGRLGEPTGVGKSWSLAWFEKSGFVTGQVYMINGGRTKSCC
jgi:hypothetical protein